MLPPERNLSDPSLYRVATANPITLIGLFAESAPHFVRRFRKIRPDYSFPQSFIDDIYSIEISRFDLSLVVALAIGWTLLRMFITEKISRPLYYYFNLSALYEKKWPESVWKFVAYGCPWLFSFYIHILSGRYSTFWDPLSVWSEWSTGEKPPIHWDIYIVYVTQASFYLHNIYATLFMDLWRKDSPLMFAHHFVALALLGISYADNFTQIGAFILFLQDNSDAALEGTKLLVYCRERADGTKCPKIKVASDILFLTFAAIWIVFRLYWYTTKFLYMTIYGGVYLGPQDAAFFPLLALLLLIIGFMNVYWFTFIARMVIRVAQTGEEPEDNREFDTVAVSGMSKQQLDAIAQKRRQEESLRRRKKTS